MQTIEVREMKERRRGLSAHQLKNPINERMDVRVPLRIRD